jgi:hypothetical protein
LTNNYGDHAVVEGKPLGLNESARTTTAANPGASASTSGDNHRLEVSEAGISRPASSRG